MSSPSSKEPASPGVAFAVAADYEEAHYNFTDAHPLSDVMPRLWDAVYALTSMSSGIVHLEIPDAGELHKIILTTQTGGRLTMELAAESRAVIVTQNAAEPETLKYLYDDSTEDTLINKLIAWTLHHCSDEQLDVLGDEIDECHKYIREGILMRHQLGREDYVNLTDSADFFGGGGYERLGAAIYALTDDLKPGYPLLSLSKLSGTDAEQGFVLSSASGETRIYRATSVDLRANWSEMQVRQSGHEIAAATLPLNAADEKALVDDVLRWAMQTIPVGRFKDLDERITTAFRYLGDLDAADRAAPQPL